MNPTWNPTKCDARRPISVNGVWTPFQCSNNRILGRDGLCESCFETRRMYTQAYDIEGKRSVKDLENIGPSKGWHGILSGPIPSYSCLTADKLARAAARKAIQNVQVT